MLKDFLGFGCSTFPQVGENEFSDATNLFGVAHAPDVTHFGNRVRLSHGLRPHGRDILTGREHGSNSFDHVQVCHPDGEFGVAVLFD